MKKPYYVIGALVISIIVLVVLLLWPRPSNSPTSPDTAVDSSAPASSTAKPGTAAGITYSPASAKDSIKVTSPIVNATLHVTTPVSVTGEAKGSWFFEGTFPASLTDAEGNVLGVAVAKAQSSWMTDAFVAFVANVAYTHEPKAGSKGYVILRKDNPSGLPQNDASVKIPVVFE